MPINQPHPSHSASAFAAWLLLFSPALLGVVEPRTLVLAPLSALLLWPLVLYKTSRLIALGALLAVGAANIVHLGYFGYLIDEFFILTALRSNSAELREFLPSVPWRLWLHLLLWLTLASGCAWWVQRHAPTASALRQQPWLRRSLWLALAIWLLACAWAGARESLSKRFVYRLRHIYPLHLVAASLRQQDIAQALLYAPQLPAPGTPGAALSAQADTIVVVLGESASAARWSLLGYQANASAPAEGRTNGALHQTPGVHVSSAMAYGFTTAQALPYLLTGLSAAASVAQRAPSFLDLAHSPAAGYKTFVYSNSRFFENQEDFFTQTLRRSADVYQKVGDGAHDGVLTASLRSALQDPAQRKLIVLHSYGSHTLLRERYPSRYQGADAYDNSIRYSSDLLAEWIDLTAGSAGARPALLLYASDHGISMPPCSSDYHHGHSLTSLEVPLLAWANPALLRSQPALLHPLTPSANQPGQYSNALLAQLALRASGFGQLADQAPWADAQQPQYQGQPWSAARQRDACSLQ